MSTISIGGRKVGSGQPCFIIAEAGVNHNGDLNLARRLIDVAADAGADAVKFQTFISEKLVSEAAPQAAYQRAAGDKALSQLDMIRAFELPFEAFAELKDYAEQRDILFLSTPFDFESADFLDGLGMAAFKVGSGDVDNLPFLSDIAKKGKPVILSTGMSDLSSVEGALGSLRAAGGSQLALLHCVSNYPAMPEDMNLRAMKTLSDAFSVPVGLSDHTLSVEVSHAAVAMGATIIEKHFTLDKSLKGPDHQASIDPDELAKLVTGTRNIEAAMGDGIKKMLSSEANVKAVARRSLFTSRDLSVGSVIKDGDVEALRPAGGLPPSALNDVTGKRVARDLAKGSRLSWKDFE